MPRPILILSWITFIALTASQSALAGTCDPTWLVYAHNDDTFAPTLALPVSADALIKTDACPISRLPPNWNVRTVLRADLTNDGSPECVLLVWRPWQDWPIMRWSQTPSPIAANQDAHGDSAHVILIEPLQEGYREIWAGSALALPITHIAVGDVDGDDQSELVALEGNYATGRSGPARHVAVWRWNGFGFTLAWRSPAGRFIDLALSDVDSDQVLEILVR